MDIKTKGNDFYLIVGEKTKVCRVCLGNVKNKAMSLFHNFHDTGLPVSNYIISIANVNIIESDGFPDKICSECLADLAVAVNFKKKCEENNRILQSCTFVTPSNDTDEIKVTAMIDKQEVKEEDPEEADYMSVENNNSFDDFQMLDDDTSDDQKPVGPKSEYTEEENLDDLIDSTQIIDNTTRTESCEAKDDDDDRLTQKPQFKSKAIDLHLQCDDCKDFFKSKCKLRVHWKRVHMRQKLVCETCKCAFKSYKTYHKHKKAKKKSCTEATNFRIEGFGKSRIIYCKECSYKTPHMSTMMTHNIRHTGERPYACHKCGTSYTQISCLMAHKEAAHGEYKVEITCQYCGKIVKGRDKVYKHLKRHTTTPENFKCNVCPKILKSSETLKLHMLRHTGHKNLQCEFCAKSFIILSELNSHKKKHFDIKFKHECDICGFKTSKKESIIIHRSQHRSDNVACKECGKFFDSKQELEVHERRHYEKNHVCKHCNRPFYRKDNLMIHIRAKHFIKTPPFAVKQNMKEDDMTCVEEKLLTNLTPSPSLSEGKQVLGFPKTRSKKSLTAFTTKTGKGI